MTAKNKHTTTSNVASVVSIPGYEIKDLLGRGGMAMVYLALQKSIGREVALKVLSPDHTDDTFSERFLREARIASQLAHPNIITIYDAGIHNDIHYMSMEYIKGKSFNEARDLLTRKQKVNIIKQIAQALDFASKKGFLHRDIKPENILLHQDGRAILTDFGIAKTTDVSKGLTETGKILGTPYFMSPEQTKGLKIDHRTDIYSLGVVLFQALAGYVPYDGPSLVAICIKHLSDPIPQLPKGLEIFQQIINTCLSKKPEHRYQHASELYDALNKITDNELDAIEAQLKSKSKTTSLQHLGENYNPATMVESEVNKKPSIKRNEHKPAQQNHIKPAPRKIIPSRNYIKPTPQTSVTDTEDFKNLNRRNKRILFLLVILAVTVGYYKKNELSAIWKFKGVPLAKQYLPAEVKKYVFTENRKTEKKPNSNRPKVIYLTVQQQQDKKNAELKESMDKIPSNAVELSEIYKKTLAADPADQKTINATEELKEWFITRANELITNKDFDSAIKSISTLEKIYPEIAQTDAFISLNENLQMEQLNEPHLQKSRVYFAVNALNLPKGANALEELKIVLNNDSENEEALKGLSKIASHFINKSRNEIENKKYFNALNSTNAGLQAIYNDPELLQLQREIKTLINSKNDIKALLNQAEKQLDNGFATNPKGTSAYDLYQQVLSTDKNNLTAIKGLSLIMKNIVKKANLFIEQNKFQEANEILTIATRLFDKSRDIQTLKHKLKKEMDAVLPIVPKIKISNTKFTAIDKTTLQKIKIGQLLYIGFEYNNFTQEKTSIKVNIYNGQLQNSSNQKLIIQKSLTILGNKGSHYFTVQLPKTGIVNGNYGIELMFGNSRLIKANLFGLH